MKVYFLGFLYPWRESPFCTTLLPLINSKTSMKFSRNFPSACFRSFWWYLPNLFVFPFPTTLHRLGLPFYLHFNNSQLYLPGLKPILCVSESPSYFLPDYSFCSILPTLSLSPYIVNVFWTACKGITRFHDIVISTYLKVQAYHISVVQSSLPSVLFISFFFLGLLHRVIASSHFKCSPD